MSIIIPIYNTEKYLEECIESVLAQTFTDFEIILVNDGSPGNADEICQKYKQKDSRIKYISKKNDGVAIARNTGISIATGEIIYCIDSDDTIKETFLAEICKAFDDSDCNLLVITPREIVDAEAIGCLQTWAFAVKRAFLAKCPDVRFQEGFQPGEDGLFSHKLLALTDKISISKSDGYNYRTNAESSEQNLNIKKLLRDIPKWFEILTDFYNKYNLWESKKYHLLFFIQNEPFGRLHCAGVNILQKLQLSQVILSFIHKNNLTEGINFEKFTPLFQLYLKSKNHLEYCLRCKINSLKRNYTHT